MTTVPTAPLQEDVTPEAGDKPNLQSLEAQVAEMEALAEAGVDLESLAATLPCFEAAFDALFELRLKAQGWKIDGVIHHVEDLGRRLVATLNQIISPEMLVELPDEANASLAECVSHMNTAKLLPALQVTSKNHADSGRDRHRVLLKGMSLAKLAREASDGTPPVDSIFFTFERYAGQIERSGNPRGVLGTLATDLGLVGEDQHYGLEADENRINDGGKVVANWIRESNESPPYTLEVLVNSILQPVGGRAVNASGDPTMVAVEKALRTIVAATKSAPGLRYS